MLVLPFWALCRILILNNYSGCKLGVHLMQSLYSIDFTNAPDVREIFGLGNHIIVFSASFYGWNVIDITRNHQVIQVYSSLVRSSYLKIANQNNNQFTTMIIDDFSTNHCRSMEDMCIPMITRLDGLILVFKDLSDLNITSFVRVMRIIMISQETPSTGSVTSLDHKELSKTIKYRHTAIKWMIVINTSL